MPPPKPACVLRLSPLPPTPTHTREMVRSNNSFSSRPSLCLLGVDALADEGVRMSTCHLSVHQETVRRCPCTETHAPPWSLFILMASSRGSEGNLRASEPPNLRPSEPPTLRAAQRRMKTRLLSCSSISNKIWDLGKEMLDVCRQHDDQDNV